MLCSLPCAGIAWFIGLLTNVNRGGYFVPVVLLALQIISCIMTNVYGITIPRFSNAVSAMLLLYVGQQVNGRLKIQFDNPYLFGAALLIVYESSLLTGSVALNHNSYKDVLQLTVGSTSALYAACYLSKKLEKHRLGKWLERCGRDSFYIMALHIVGFKLCTMFLMAAGVVDGGLENVMTPPIGGNVLLLGCYTLCGLFFPLAFLYLFRRLKAVLKNHIQPGKTRL